MCSSKLAHLLRVLLVLGRGSQVVLKVIASKDFERAGVNLVGVRRIHAWV